jgi:hypothetical protein
MNTQIDWLSSTITGPPVLVWTSPSGVALYRREVVFSQRSGNVLPHGHAYVAALPSRCTDAPMTFTHEEADDRFLESIGIAGRVKTGDAAFDDAVAIDTEASPETVHSLLASPSSRAELRGLLVMTGRVLIEGNTITVRVGLLPAADDRAREVALFDALLRFVASLGEPGAQPFRQGAPAQVHIVPAKQVGFHRAALVLALAVGGGAALASASLHEHTAPMFPNDLATMGLCAGAAAWLVLSVLALLVLRGRHQSPREIALASAALLGLLPFGGVVAELANAALPGDGDVLRCNAFLDSRPLPKGGRSLTLTTPKGQLSVPERVVVGPVPYRAQRTPVVVESRVGALGAESITRVIVVPDAP